MIADEVLDDVFIFTNGLTIQDKKHLNKILVQHEDQFYVPKFRGRYPMNLKIACLGKHWSATDNKYHDHRLDYDKKPVKPIPVELIDIAAKFSLAAFPYHLPSWDICIINEYAKGSTLGIHADISESEDALKIGHPVVSFSLGASCEFVLGKKRAAEESIKLNNGDVLVFGGGARRIFHGVKEVEGGKRINLTLRKF